MSAILPLIHLELETSLIQQTFSPLPPNGESYYQEVLTTEGETKPETSPYFFKITKVIFADGAPLKTVHLPSSITNLTLNNSKSLTKILNNKPQYYDYDSTIEFKENRVYTPNLTDKTGLYIEGITDYNKTEENVLFLNTNFTQLNLNNVNLGYGSWTILSNMLSIWDKVDNENKRK